MIKTKKVLPSPPKFVGPPKQGVSPYKVQDSPPREVSPWKTRVNTPNENFDKEVGMF